MKNQKDKSGWGCIVCGAISVIIFLVIVGFFVVWVGNFFIALTTNSQIAVFVAVIFLLLWSVVMMDALDSNDDIDSGPGGPL